jgi:hypothetical protein
MARTGLVCLVLAFLMGTDAAKAIDWCSNAPRPVSARLIVKEAKLEPLFRSGVVIAYSKVRPLPSHTWCDAHDDQQGGNRREGPCLGTGSGSCLQGWVSRILGEDKYEIWLKVINQHSNDTRFFTVYDDLGPADPRPRLLWPRAPH